MNNPVVVIGATGTIGSEVVKQLLAHDIPVRAVSRSATRVAKILGTNQNLDFCEADIRDQSQIASAIAHASGIIMTHGAPYGDDQGYQDVDFGAVRNIVRALENAADTPKIVLMSSIGTSLIHEGIAYWKRQGELALENSDLSWAIIRPGWFTEGIAGSAHLDTADTTQQVWVNVSDVASTLIAALDPAISGVNIMVTTADNQAPVAEQFAALMAR